MAILDTTKNAMINLFKDITKIKDIDRDVLKDLIDSEATAHKNFVKAVSAMTKPDMDKFKERMMTLIPSSKVKAVSAWSEYKKSLNTKASQVEQAKMFDSLVKARTIYGNIMSELGSDLNKVFPSEIVAFQNMTQSQTLVFGTLMQSMILSNWTEYMWTLLSSLVDGTETDIPKYRLDFLTKYVKQVVDTVNGILMNEKMSVVDTISSMKSSGKDAALVVDGAVNTKGFLGLSAGATLGVKIAAGLIAAYLLAPVGMHLFRMGIEKLEMISHEKYLKNKEMKEWLEAHVAKLRLELQNINPNDPQYQKLLKIIDAYDEKIRDLDQKINEYLDM